MALIAEKPLEWFGCRGMLDLEDGNRDRDYASWLQNVFPLDPQRGGALVARSGFTACTGVPAVAGAAIQLIYHYEKLDGTIHVVGIFAGEIYTHASGAWTRQVTTANLATAVVTLSTTTKCYAVTYNNTMVISDGVNKPFTWNGAAGAGGLVPLTNTSGAWYGRPTVYYGKLFGILNGSRATIEWSEENAANTGYAAGGYNNQWTLGQAGSAPLTAIFGTNSALYYWRPSSTGVITGAVTPDFASSGTHDAVSREIGTLFPNAVIMVGDTIFFLDRFYRPWCFGSGGDPQPIWRDIGRQFANTGGDFVWPLLYTVSAATYTNTTTWESRMFFGGRWGFDLSVHSVSAVYVPWFDQVVFFMRMSASAAANSEWTVGAAFSASTRRAQGYWDLPWGCSEVNCGPSSGSGTTTSSPTTLYAGGTPTVGSVAPQVAYTFARTRGIDDAAAFQSGLGAAAWRVIAPRLGWSGRKRASYNELTWILRQRTSATVYSYSSQYFTSDLPTVDLIAAGVTLTKPTANRPEHKTTVGINGQGRWIAPMLTVTAGASADTVLPLIHGCEVQAAIIAGADAQGT